LIPPADPYFQLTSWGSQVNPYGPLNQFFYLLAGLASMNNFWLSLAAHKLLPLTFLLASLVVVSKTLQKYYPQSQSQGIILLFWNPLFILETAGSGHNDILWIFFALAAIYFWLGKKFFISGLLLALAVQVKFIPVILFIFLLASLTSKERQGALQFAGAFITVNILAFLYLGSAVFPFLTRLVLGASIYWQSLPQLVHPLYGQEKIFFTTSFLLLLTSALILVLKQRITPLLGYVVVMFFYLLLLTSVYWNWYILWILFLIPFLGKTRLTRPILIFSATSLLAYPLYWLSLRFGFGSLSWQVIIYLFIALPPLASFFHEKIIRRPQD